MKLKLNYVAQAGLELSILLPPPPNCLEYRYEPPSLAIFERTSCMEKKIQDELAGTSACLQHVLPSATRACWLQPHASCFRGSRKTQTQEPELSTQASPEVAVGVRKRMRPRRKCVS